MAFGKRQPSGYLGHERRRAPRQQTDVIAHIALASGQVFRCHVADFSVLGARLAVASVFGLPDTFEMRAAGKTYQVQITRRGKGHIGVRFV